MVTSAVVAGRSGSAKGVQETWTGNCQQIMETISIYIYTIIYLHIYLTDLTEISTSRLIYFLIKIHLNILYMEKYEDLA